MKEMMGAMAVSSEMIDTDRLGIDPTADLCVVPRKPVTEC
jgi:hypothetical protein